MKYGLQTDPADTGMPPDLLARAAEERGFYSLSVAEHTHIPVTSVPRTGGAVPEGLKRCHDPFVWLMAAAAATSELMLGTGICLVAQRDAVTLAKEVASLDSLSNGRFIFGVGYGWNEAEMVTHGLDFRRRREVLREKVLAMRELWTNEVASFSGDHVSFSPSWSWPKPAQQPHPPIVLGATAGPRTLAHIVEFCDGWMPNGVRAEDVAALRRAADDAGRDPSSIELTAHRAADDPAELDRLAGLGVDRVSFYVPPEPADVVLPLLDRFAATVAAHAGA